ncbi:hypothetical protein [Aliarcobacter cryaerophilus]|nr:hypothetical protein [Aliarcobacter cryaerophilus]
MSVKFDFYSFLRKSRKYYSKKYGVTIFHVVNGSENRIYRP